MKNNRTIKSLRLLRIASKKLQTDRVFGGINLYIYTAGEGRT